MSFENDSTLMEEYIMRINKVQDYIDANLSSELSLLILNRIKQAGNTVIIVEHNPDIMVQADWIIDLGPEGGNAGGTIAAQGTPEQVAQSGSYTGNILKELLFNMLE